MKKLVVFVAVLLGIGVLAKRFAPSVGSIDWEKRFEDMPDNAPPKWVFNNVTAIRENTERIIDLLESRGGSPGQPTSPERGAVGLSSMSAP